MFTIESRKLGGSIGARWCRALRIAALFIASISPAHSAVFWQVLDGDNVESSGGVSALVEQSQQVIVLNDPNGTWNFCIVKEQVLEGQKVGSLRCVAYGSNHAIAEILCGYPRSQFRISSVRSSQVWSRLLVLMC